MFAAGDVALLRTMRTKQARQLAEGGPLSLAAYPSDGRPDLAPAPAPSASLLETAVVRSPRPAKPKLPFYLGVASSAYQSEGAVIAGGRGQSIWDVFTADPKNTAKGETGGDPLQHSGLAVALSCQRRAGSRK